MSASKNITYMPEWEAHMKRWAATADMLNADESRPWVSTERCSYKMKLSILCSLAPPDRQTYLVMSADVATVDQKIFASTIFVF